MTEPKSNKAIDIIGSIQSDFPVTELPFQDIGARLGMSGSEVVSSVQSLLESGVIRTFGPVFNPRKLGYITTLIAAEVADDRVAEIAAVMLDIREITHNYLREHKLNLWFTITAVNEDTLDNIVKYVEKFAGVRRVLNLPATKIYKIRAVFGSGEETEPYNINENMEITRLDDRDKALIVTLQDAFPFVDKPYHAIAEKAGMTETEVMSRIASWVEDGTIRRFGARLNHRRAGYISNSLGAWRSDDIDTLGAVFAQLPYVSHCYRREPRNDWQYELYTMIHAVSKTDLKKKENEMRALAPNTRPVFMKSLFELKKTSMKYFLEKSDTSGLLKKTIDSTP